MDLNRVRLLKYAAAVMALAGLAACASAGRGGAGTGAYRAANLRPYDVGRRHYAPAVVDHYDREGVASWYSYPAGTRRTATGEWFDASRLTAAHKTLPLPCVVEVTNLENGRRTRVRVNDRGPFAEGRLIDLSKAAADQLGFTRQGVTRVRIRLMGPAALAEAGTVMLASRSARPDAGLQAMGDDLF